MNSNVELHIAFKCGIIAVGVIHVIFGIAALAQAIKEAIAFGDTMDKQAAMNEWERRKGFGKDATIAPAFFLPLVAGAVCIVFAFISRFYIIFIIIAAKLLAAILYIVALARVHAYYGKHGGFIEGELKKKMDTIGNGPTKDFIRTLKPLDAVLTGNLILAYIGFFFTLATIGLSGYIAYSYWPGRDSGGTETKTEKSTCEAD